MCMSILPALCVCLVPKKVRKSIRSCRTGGQTVVSHHVPSGNQTQVLCKSNKCNWWWWQTLLIPALGRQRQVDLCEFEANLVYRASSRTGSKATEKHYLGKKNQQQKRMQFCPCYKLLFKCCNRGQSGSTAPIPPGKPWFHYFNALGLRLLTSLEFPYSGMNHKQTSAN